MKKNKVRRYLPTMHLFVPRVSDPNRCAEEFVRGPEDCSTCAAFNLDPFPHRCYGTREQHYPQREPYDMYAKD